ncbi:type II toxin-antitoxin system RelE/ParE family toxin [Wenzhouxiangella sp. EGI_FJ10305]|uniref:type II toxin-antitoxin system RelE/ParE family toxin n=1 Tax=Wenzhouxiangella sp. EGI_FJ10305 TaxID=3243768 RepID=UPI0035DF282D
MSPFTLSVIAEEDLIQIYTDGATTFGLEQAKRYHRKLFQVFRFLAENPLAAPIRPELRTDVRVHPAESHIVLYTVRTQDILSLRIRHAHEDWLDH